jgi:hypothetical protein
VEEHGAEAIPVADQSDLERAKEQGHETVILMPAVQRQLIHRSSFFSMPPPKIIKRTPREELLSYFIAHSGDMTDRAKEQFEELLEMAERWYV